MEGKKSNTGLIVGVSVAAVILVIIVIASRDNSSVYYPTNGAPYNNAGTIYGEQTDRAALYTGAASVINNALDTFFNTNKQKNEG